MSRYTVYVLRVDNGNMVVTVYPDNIEQPPISSIYCAIHFHTRESSDMCRRLIEYDGLNDWLLNNEKLLAQAYGTNDDELLGKTVKAKKGGKEGK